MKVGQRHMQLIGAWLPSLSIFGAAGALTGAFVAEWRDVLQFLPYYGSKYPPPEE